MIHIIDVFAVFAGEYQQRGIGIVAMGLLILPFLRIGGMQFFRMESSERADKPVARVQTFAGYLLTIYVLLTLASDIANAWLDPRIRVA